jgi:PAS domain S-box-containing protein
LGSAKRTEPTPARTARRAPPARPFRTHLVRLVFAIALPLVLLAAGLVSWTAQGRRAQELRGLEQTALALQLAIDRELGLITAALQALATSPALDQALAGGAGSPLAAAFHAQATSLVESQGDILQLVWLAPADRPVPIVNTRVPVGEAPPPLVASRHPPRPIGPLPDPRIVYRQVIENGQPHVTDLVRGAVVDWTMQIFVPVRRDGRVVAMLSAGLRPERLGEVLRAAAPRRSGVAALIDRGGVVAARSVEAARFVGQPATPDLVEVLREPEMRARSVALSTLNGDQVYGAVRRLDTAPLTIAYGVPREMVDAPFRRSLAMAAAFALLALGVAVGGALWLGGRLGAEVAALGADAARLAEGAPLPDRPAAQVREVAAARDAMVQSAASLSESEGRFTRAVSAAAMGTWEWDARRNRLTGSPGREALYGRPPGSLATREAMVEAVHPEDRSQVEAAIAAATADRAEGRYRVEFRTIWPDGTTRWLRSQGRCELDADGAPLRISGAVVDVTERRLAEEALRDSERRLRLAQQAGGIGVWERDLATGKGTWSEQEYRLHDLDPAGPAPTGEELRALMVPEDRGLPLLFERLRDAGPVGEEGGPPMTAEYRVRSPRTGRLRWVHLAGRVLPGPDGKPARVVGVSLDVTEVREAEERQRLLMREVDHRAKNALAVALSVVQLAPRDVPPEIFAGAVIGRIAAMARTHSLLADQRWQGADLRALAEAELATHADHVVLDGPAVRLVPDAAQPVAMLLHELATNAAKHGALSVVPGMVRVQWRREPAGDLLLSWEERGGPMLAGAPSRAGFGSRLLSSLVERQLGGRVVFDWSDPAGLSVEVRLPARHLAAKA